MMAWIDCLCGTRLHNTSGSWLLTSPEDHCDEPSYEVWRCYKCGALTLIKIGTDDRHDLAGVYAWEGPLR